MSDICPVCTLPKDLCVCETIEKEEQKITIGLAKRRFGKLATVIQGIEGKNIDVKAVAKKLKSKLACGGTYKKGVIELQGNHAEKVKRLLVELGFTEGAITVKANPFKKKRR